MSLQAPASSARAQRAERPDGAAVPTPLREPRAFSRAPREAPLQARLEAGEVAILSGVRFELGRSDPDRLARAVGRPGAAARFDPVTGRLSGVSGGKADHAWTTSVLMAYAGWALSLLWERLPAYAPHLALGEASFRAAAPAPPAGRRVEGGRLRIDAFPARPSQGRRILRVFCNLGPREADAAWQVGEAFEAHAWRFAPKLRPPSAPPALLEAARLTRGRRTEYDALMLALRDAAGADAGYQAEAARRTLGFPPGAAWLAFTDAIPHAPAGAGLVLQQTFFLPVEALADPAAAPLKVLERITGRALV